MNEDARDRFTLARTKGTHAAFPRALELIETFVGAGERVSFPGQFYQTSKATIYDRPAKPVQSISRERAG